MSLSIYQVDAFTDRPFTGNPAAVCLLEEPGDTGWMQSVAGEMNLSETAFLVPQEGGYDLRWFTPTVEVDLCGHATLACGHVLWETGELSPGQVARFHTRSGELTARSEADWITLDLPAFETKRMTPPVDVVEGLGAKPVAVSLVSNGQDYVVEMESEEAVRRLRPDFVRLGRLKTGLIATAQAENPEVDFVSRYFGPAFGIDEDPVTGYAHCVLGPYWQERLGKDQFIAHQISERGGVLRVRVEGDRIALSGQAVTMFCGKLTERAAAARKSP